MSRNKKRGSQGSAPRESDAQIKIVRNDDLIKAQAALHEIRPPRERGGLSKGWLGPEVCWALYKQFGVLRQLLSKVANQAVAKGWRWTEDGVGYDWSGVSSNLETLGFQTELKKGIKWAHVEGGAGLVWRLDETQREGPAIESLPVVPANVRGVERIEVYAATSLRPLSAEGGIGLWDTCEHFEILHRNGRREVVHRSRVVPLVVDDIPMGGRVATLYSSTTGWPPSWLDGVIDSLQSWRDAESTTDNLLFTISLLILELEGAREAMTSPNEQERTDFAALIKGISDTLSSHGLLALPRGDKIGEVGRNTGGVDKIVDQKKRTFVADTGYSAERVLMETRTGLGDTSNGPRLDDHETIEGIQESICTPAINRASEFELMAVSHAAAVTNITVEIPTKWVIKFNPLATQTKEEKAKTRETTAKARATDLKAGVPQRAVLSDPELTEHYPDLAEILAAARLAEEETQAAGSDPSRPSGSEPLRSASEIGGMLGVSAATILAMRARGLIRGWKIGGRWRFAWSQVQAALGEEIGALQGAQGELGDAARRARQQLLGDGRIDAELWRALDVHLLGCRMDALPPGLELSTSTEWGGNYGASEAMREVFALLERVGPTDLPVLILGETGTGKEGIARGLHDARGSVPFIAVNCGELGDDAREVTEALLGDGAQPGLFGQAAGGTLFLDEVGELESEAQAVLLRALSGESRVRVVSATWHEIGIPGKCDFRRDLYERLAGVVVELPPLRERGEDIVVLAEMFLERVAAERGLSPAPALGVEARAVLLAHPWPGNIRELLNAIRRAVVFAGAGAVIMPEHLQLHVGRVP